MILSFGLLNFLFVFPNFNKCAPAADPAPAAAKKKPTKPAAVQQPVVVVEVVDLTTKKATKKIPKKVKAKWNKREYKMSKFGKKNNGVEK